MAGIDNKQGSIRKVGEVLPGCDPRRLLDIILECESGWDISYDQVGERAKAVLVRRIAASLGLMGDIEGEELEGEQGINSGEIIVPWESFELIDARGAFKRKLSARVVAKPQIDSARGILSDVGGTVSSIGMMEEIMSDNCKKDNVVKLLSQDNEFFRRLSYLRNASWTAVLGMSVMLPETLCEKERYCVLANIFWTMTYYGFFTVAVADVDNRNRYFGETYGENMSEDLSIEAMFYESYGKKMQTLMELMNYNSIVASLELMVNTSETIFGYR